MMKSVPFVHIVYKVVADADFHIVEESTFGHGGVFFVFDKEDFFMWIHSR